MNLTALFLLILPNVALILVASRRGQIKCSRSSSPSSYSRFNLIVAMFAAGWIGLVVGARWPSNFKTFADTWGIQTFLGLSALIIALEVFRPQRASQSSATPS